MPCYSPTGECDSFYCLNVCVWRGVERSIMLKPIDEVPKSAAILYSLLEERTPEQSISHKEMPSFEDHVQFIASNPYLCWYIILDASLPVGAIYLTRQREIGIGIFKGHKGRSYGKKAVRELIGMHPGKFLANVNPHNMPSHHFFQENFNTEVIQITYECSL